MDDGWDVSLETHMMITDDGMMGWMDDLTVE